MKLYPPQCSSWRVYWFHLVCLSVYLFVSMYIDWCPLYSIRNIDCSHFIFRYGNSPYGEGVSHNISYCTSFNMCVMTYSQNAGVLVAPVVFWFKFTPFFFCLFLSQIRIISGKRLAVKKIKSHCLNQWWLSSLKHKCVTEPQKVNLLCYISFFTFLNIEKFFIY